MKIINNNKQKGFCRLPIASVICSGVDPKLFFSDPDPTFQELSDPDQAPDPILDLT